MIAEPQRKGAGAGQASVRRHNLSVVLRLLTDDGPRSRSAIAEGTGLTKATVSKLVAELADRGLVRDTSVVQGASGRPATLVDLSGTVVAIGLVIDVDFLTCGAVDLLGRTHHAETIALDNRSSDPATDIRRAAALVRRTLERARSGSQTPVGVHVAVPGLTSAGHVLVAPNLGWHDVALAKLLQGRLGDDGDLAVAVDNEANLAALAERRRRDERTFIHVSAGVGVGAGVVIDGALYRGAHGFGGEFGHFVVDPAGRRCRCGNRGCVETIVGKDALLQATGGRRRWTGTPDAAWVEGMLAAVAADDTRTTDALRDVADALAAGLSSAASLFDPEVIVLGGYLTGLTPWLAPQIERRLSRQVLGARWIDYRVEASRAGALAPLVGGAWSTLEQVIDDPLAAPSRAS